MRESRIADSPNLNLLRSIAIGCVLLAHGLRMLGVRPAHFHFGALGFAGVLMFFVHTSLVLMMSLDRQHARTPGGGGLFRGFVLRRALRIYPLSVTVVLVSWLLSVAHVLERPPLSPAELLANLALVQNLTDAPSRPGPLWTLPIEMQMYLAFPALYLLTRRRIGPWFAAWAALVGVSWVAAELGVRSGVLQFVPCFLPGIIAYMRHDVRPTLPAPTLPVALILLAALYSALVAHGVTEVVLAPVVALALGLLLPHVKELSSHRVAHGAKIVATYSYGLYLVHADVMSIVGTRCGAWPVAVRIALVVVAISVLSVAAYHSIERPGISLGAELEGRWITRPRSSVSNSTT